MPYLHLPDVAVAMAFKIPLKFIFKEPTSAVGLWFLVRTFESKTGLLDIGFNRRYWIFCFLGLVLFPSQLLETFRVAD
ncbi:MAG: hypothetical protein EAY68_06765 [Bacteroidetes bacterium]|nr:MAG: hypothetical protein EAY68_06765 [Bacteroidota bacterium]